MSVLGDSPNDIQPTGVPPHILLLKENKQMQREIDSLKDQIQTRIPELIREQSKVIIERVQDLLQGTFGSVNI